MINHDNLLLAIFPAVIAILLEAINPLSEIAVVRQAEEAVRKHSLTPDRPDVMAKFSLGAISVSGLAPTMMSVLTATLGILHELPLAAQFWSLYVVLVVFAFIALWMGREIGKQGFYDMAVRYVTVFGWPLITYSKLHSVYIYGMNLLLIALCIVLWRM